MTRKVSENPSENTSFYDCPCGQHWEVPNNHPAPAECPECGDNA